MDAKQDLYAKYSLTEDLQEAKEEFASKIADQNELLDKFMANNKPCLSENAIKAIKEYSDEIKTLHNMIRRIIRIERDDADRQLIEVIFNRNSKTNNDNMDKVIPEFLDWNSGNIRFSKKEHTQIIKALQIYRNAGLWLLNPVKEEE
jgi:hypothetical protein